MEKPSTKKLTLAPIDFDEAVTDLLKVKPPPKPPKKTAQSKQTENTKKKRKKGR